MTYMNLSGESVVACAHFYKIPAENILVIFDDIDMVFGKIRYRKTGNAGGHNGIHSIIQTLGTPDIPRIKIGIDRRPNIDPSDWVLSKFSKEEITQLPDIFESAQEKLREVLKV